MVENETRAWVDEAVSGRVGYDHGRFGQEPVDHEVEYRAVVHEVTDPEQERVARWALES
jgi:hypothetical protein